MNPQESINFSDLQLAIDSDGWKTDPQLRGWLWNQYLVLVENGATPPTNFGSEEFWKVFNAEYFDFEDAENLEADEAEPDPELEISVDDDDIWQDQRQRDGG